MEDLLLTPPKPNQQKMPFDKDDDMC